MSGKHHHDHDHDHQHAHGHDPHDPHPHEPIEDHDSFTEFHLLEQALRELLTEAGIFSAADIQRQIEKQESKTPALGARIVAKAWTDEKFRRDLLADPKPTITAMGIDVSNTPELVVLENGEGVHHVVVCTLCSCYPRMILGIPPAWYKSREYRARVVREPRTVLEEFGVSLPDKTEIRVVDSTADLRYLVIPERPRGTETLNEAALAELVSRDSMIGTGLVRSARAA
ncbi:MAG: nitrile hydratase subunit alpha [Betaproteobacteria bacterium]|jgi:nitrile hydratase